MRYVHGLSHTRVHNTWNHMMSRCYSPKDKRYSHYGGRGIKVTPKWHKFINFWNDMKDGYADNLTLDRIDNNGDYNKKNCRWVTWSIQERNRQDALKVKYKGKIYPLKDLCEKFNKSYIMVWIRIFRHNWSIEKALTIPSRNKNGRTKNNYDKSLF